MGPLLEIINIVLPVFVIIGLGYFLGLRRFFPPPTITHLSRFVFYVSGPALLFRGAAGTRLVGIQDLGIIGAVSVVSILLVAAVYGFSSRLAPARRGVFTQGAYRSNMVFFGLPVIANAFGDEGLTQVALMVGFTIPLYNFLAVAVLVFSQGRTAGTLAQLRLALKSVVTNPLVLACAAGMLVSGTHLPVPASLDRAAELVGRVALPLALIVLGLSLNLKQLRGSLGLTLGASLIKLGLYPALIYLVLRWWGLSGVQLQAQVLLMTSPTAVASYIMAVEMKGDGQLASAIVIGSTLLSLVTISVWLALFQWLG